MTDDRELELLRKIEALVIERDRLRDAHTVKTLTWTELARPDETCRYDHCVAETPWGSYSIEWKSWKDYPSYIVMTPHGGVLTGGSDSLDDAKAVAQAHFAEMVLACLALPALAEKEEETGVS